MTVSGMGMDMGRPTGAATTPRVERAASAEWWVRGGAWAGIAFVPLFVVRFVAFLDTPDGDAPVSEWTEHFEDSGNRMQSVVGGYLMALAGLAFLWFLVALCRRPHRPDVRRRPAVRRHGVRLRGSDGVGGGGRRVR
jgi:hypothetical protein